MSTLLAFVQSVADACAEVPVTSVINAPNNASFIRKTVVAIDDALNHLSTLHQWEWLVKRVTPLSASVSIPDLVRVRDVMYDRQKLPYVPTGEVTPNYPCYTTTASSVTVFNVTPAQVPNLVIVYESNLVGFTRADATLMPVPQEYEYGLREYVLYLLHTRHVNDAKRAAVHLQNALSAYDILKAREHSHKQTFNRYRGVRR
jgi:hypothetical protein